jgi:RNA polymerase sigma-70 factor (ECF subfamily)
VKRAQAGDEQAFGFLIDQTQDRLFRFFTYLTSSRQLAEDLSQDTYIKALENIKKLKTPELFLSWLFKTGKNLFLDHVRLHKNSRSVTVAEIPESPEGAPSGGGPTLNLDIKRALDALPPDDRVVLVLVDMEAHSYLEASEIIGISESALRSRVHRARKAFMQIYGG